MDILNDTINYLNKYGQDLIKQIRELDGDPSTFRYAAHAFEVDIVVMGEETTLVVALPARFPSQLPRFFCKDGQFGFIPHLEIDGLLCFTRNENMVIDERYPGEVVLNCLLKVMSLIEDGVSGKNKHDFIEEFEVHWSRGLVDFTVHTMLDEGNETVRETNLFKVPTDSGYYIFVSEKKINPLPYINILFQGGVPQNEVLRCIFVPLQSGTFFYPPKPGKTWTLDEYKANILDNLSEGNKSRFLRLLHRTPKSNGVEDYFIVSVPIGEDRSAIFGFNLDYPDKENRSKSARVKSHPLLGKSSNLKITPFSIFRNNKDFLLKRTGGNPTLANKHAVVIGLGSIGSPVTMGLAKAGFEKLTLVDFDELSVENIYRHELGTNRIFEREETVLRKQHKVRAMEKEIYFKYPLVKVRSIAKDIRDVLESGIIDWSNVDIVIVCVGSPNIEMTINRFMHKQLNPVPVLYTWLEPLGIGGHILVTLNSEKKGCYQCLFRPINEYTPISNHSAFAGPNQSFTISLTGCGSYFTPYNYLDSEQTTNLALRTVFNILLGRTVGNPILSWKGDASLFSERGFTLSRRFYMSDEILFNKRQEYIDENCPVCSSGDVN